jgi:hypothetical protein
VVLNLERCTNLAMLPLRRERRDNMWEVDIAAKREYSPGPHWVGTQYENDCERCVLKVQMHMQLPPCVRRCRDVFEMLPIAMGIARDPYYPAARHVSRVLYTLSSSPTLKRTNWSTCTEVPCVLPNCFNIYIQSSSSPC